MFGERRGSYHEEVQPNRDFEADYPVRRSGVKHSRHWFFMLLLKVALALTILCLVIAIYAMANYLGDNHDKRLAAEVQLKSTYQYFDANRKLMGIQNIDWRQQTALGVSTPCAAGYTEESIYRWPGAWPGNVDANGKYTAVTTAGATATIPAKAPQTSKFWKHGKFCVMRVAATNMKAATNGACATGQQQCSTCECRFDSTWAAMTAGTAKTTAMQQACPVTAMVVLTNGADISATNYVLAGNARMGWWFCAGSGVAAAPMVDTNIGGTAANRYLACTNANRLKNTYVVDLQVEMQDKPCVDPNAHPLPSDASTNTIYNLLKEDMAGCGTVLGVDSGLSTQVDSDTFLSFIASNTATVSANTVGTKLFDFYKASNVPMKLFTRNKITVKCTSACDVYRTNYSF